MYEPREGHVLDSTARLMLFQLITQLTLNAQNTSALGTFIFWPKKRECPAAACAIQLAFLLTVCQAE